MTQRIPHVPFSVSLRRLFPGASFVGCADIRVTAATERSDECRPNMLFAAIPGTRLKGSQFAEHAICRGANALLVHEPLAYGSAPQCVVSNVRSAYAELCAALEDYPSRDMSLAGVTGTNGKTTVTWLIRSILQAAERQVGLLGTIEYSDGIDAKRAELTTPDSKSLTAWLASMVRKQTLNAAIELSSHALEQDRAVGTSLDAAIVTNITQDHFDYHKNYESYWQSKSKLLSLVKKDGVVVLNADDPGSIRLRERMDAGVELVTFGLSNPANITARVLSEGPHGSRFLLNMGTECVEVSTPLVGQHNISNCLAAAAAARHMGAGLDDIAAGIELLTGVPGRLERVHLGQGFNVFVDYAHTDDALWSSLACLRRQTSGRLFCVFGAGGDRDRSKRALLGRAAAYADVAVVTSDNPRSEEPMAIIQDILEGFTDQDFPPHIEPDRIRAIHWALAEAEPGDCVLVAGKGHETEQIIGIQRIPHDDRQVVREALASLARPVFAERMRA